MNDLPTLMQLSTSPEAAGTGIVQRPAVVPGAAQVAPARGAIEVTWARHLDEVREAQRLRFEVFAAEMGARLTTPVPGHDVDLFDDYCEHLLVRDAQSLQVIGTYRVLTPAQAKRVGGTYSDTEFDLTRLRSLRPRMVELGRSCVHPDHRHGGVIMALWGALAEFMVRNQLDTMIGCASIPMLHNGVVSGDAAASIWNQVKQTASHPMWQDIPDNAYFYFVHSFHCAPADPALVLAVCDYAGEFCCAIARGRVFATQFHPEKSGRVGEILLENFLKL